MVRLTHPIRGSEERDVVLPRAVLERSGLTGDVTLSVEDGRIVIESSGHAPPRAGWEEAAKILAAAADDELMVGEFGNQFDEGEWAWPQDEPR